MPDYFHILDTPREASQIVDPPEDMALSTTGAWTTVANATLAANLAKYALIKLWAKVDSCTTSGAYNRIYLRETGSGLGLTDQTKKCEAYAEGGGGMHATQGSAVDTNECWVKLDSSHQFDYYLAQGGTASFSRDFTLVAWK